MKRNGMCPICYLKQFLIRREKVSKFAVTDFYDNGFCKTPPMGWSSWNTFRNNIDETLMRETAQLMVDKGLAEAGYKYLNLDDCWQSNLRDENGDLQGDLVRFRGGMDNLIKDINKLGLKVGLYTSNGTLTCEDLPASLDREYADAKTFAKWGVEYFKYDYCHHRIVTRYAPLVYSITISRDGVSKDIPCTDAQLVGLAKFMPNKKLPTKQYISGMDSGLGKAVFSNVYVEEAGDYVLTINILKKGEYEKFLQVKVNDDNYYYDFPSQKPFNLTARFQAVVKLDKGQNRVELTNPITNRADGAYYQYYKMGQALKAATVGKKPIVYSICEWGANKPYQWGAHAGNLWRTTPDIRPIWPWIKIIYNHNVGLYKNSTIGGYNDPDMLEVGNGKLSDAQNKSHFSLWCMMNSPLILGNDLRIMKDNILDIVTNKEMIAINQDILGKAAKRVKKGSVDILAKPLSENRVAVCFFNKGKGTKSASIKLSQLVDDEYVQMKSSNKYSFKEVWSNETGDVSDVLNTTVDTHSSKVFILSIVK